MSNIIRFAPYAYMAKRSGNNTLYDLLLLIPVGNSGDTDLSNVGIVKSTDKRFTISYTTNGSATSLPYRFKHFVVDNEEEFIDIEIKGGNNADHINIITFADADTEEATVTNQYQTCAPYLFLKKEMVDGIAHINPSCVILFDPGLGAQNEVVTFAPNSCIQTIILGNNGVITDPTKLVINQNLKAVLTPNQVFAFEGNVAGNSSLSKPPRKNKVRQIWYI